MGATVVKISNLMKRYKERIAVNDFSLTIKQGEILGLLGPNGSGKTTTINCLLSLLKYDSGNIEIFGKKMSPDSYSIKRNIGVIPQNIAVFEELNVFENIDYFCGLYVLNKKERKLLVERAIDFVKLDEFKNYYPKKLSGGLLRRLNIACGIAHKPKLIIMDEPTVSVDPQSRNQILESVLKLNKNGATIIYTSHYMEEVEHICSQIIIIDKGKNLAEGTKEELKMMINNGETISAEIFELNPHCLKEISNLENVYLAKYKNNLLQVKCQKGKNNLSNVINYLNNNSISYSKLTSQLPTLNDVFLEMTEKKLRD